MNPRVVRAILITIFIADGVVIGVVTGFALHSAALGAAMGVGAAILPVVVLRSVVPLGLWISGWNELARLYPPVPGVDAPGGARVQSVAMRWPVMAFNNCVRVWADERHLHLRLCVPFCPRNPASIPWTAVQEATASLGRTRLTLVQGPTLWVPSDVVQAPQAAPP